MYVQPVSTSRGGRRGRRSLLPIALPVVALVATVAAGWAGRLSAPAEPVAVQPPAPTVRSAVTEPPAAVEVSAPREVPPAGAPGQAFDLPVVGVIAALEAQRAGGIDGLVAVAGHFTLDPRAGDCLEEPSSAPEGSRAPFPPGPFCRRSGLLASRPEHVLAVDHNGIAPEAVRLTVAVPLVNVRVRGGVALPSILDQVTARPGAVEPVPAVLVGRFNEPRSATCRPDTPRCRGDFVLERVAWIAGEWYEPPLLVAGRPAPLGPQEGAAARPGRGALGTPSMGPLLTSVVATREALAWIDRGAADAVRATSSTALWYMRWAARPEQPEPGSTRHVGWTVVDPVSGAVLGEGVSRSPLPR